MAPKQAHSLLTADLCNSWEGLSMRLKTVFAAAVMFVAGMFTAAEAAPITYTLSGNGTGLVVSTLFTDAAFTWTLSVDSSAVFHEPAGVPSGYPFAHVTLPFTSDSLTIAGIGTLTPSLQVFGRVPGFNGPGSIVFSDFNIHGGIIFGSPALTTYNGTASIGPIAVGFEGSAPLPSNMGNFGIGKATNMVFQVTGVPEPITLALFGAGLAGIGALRRRRQKV